MKSVSACLLLVGVASVALAAGPIEVIYTNLPGDPTAVAPGVTDPNGSAVTRVYRHPLAPFLTLGYSPSGEHWVFKAFIDDVENDVLVVGSGNAGAVVSREANPVAGVPGRFIDFLDSDVGVNDSGHYIYGARLDAPTSDDEVALFWDGAMELVAAREGDMAPDLNEPFGLGGDELFGNALNSVHMLSDSTPAFYADQIQNIVSSRQSAVYHGANALVQEGTVVDGMQIGGPTSSGFKSNADGSIYVARADIDSTISNVPGLISNNLIVVRQGDFLAGGSRTAQVDGIFDAVAGSTFWLARGDEPNNGDWVAQNGSVIALTGDSLNGSTPESWGNSIGTISVNINDDVLIGGATDNPNVDRDNVILLNSTRVVAREGDPVDLNGNGAADDNVFIGSFDTGDAFLSTDGWLYLFCGLRDAGGTDIGDGFVRTRVSCPGDVDGSGAIDLGDLAGLLAAFGLSYTDAGFIDAADSDGSGTIDLGDLAGLLAGFGAPCP